MVEGIGRECDAPTSLVVELKWESSDPGDSVATELDFQKVTLTRFI